jgi:hypothetical protein
MNRLSRLLNNRFCIAVNVLVIFLLIAGGISMLVTSQKLWPGVWAIRPGLVSSTECWGPANQPNCKITFNYRFNGDVTYVGVDWLNRNATGVIDRIWVSELNPTRSTLNSPDGWRVRLDIAGATMITTGVVLVAVFIGCYWKGSGGEAKSMDAESAGADDISDCRSENTVIYQNDASPCTILSLSIGEVSDEDTLNSSQ